MTLSLPPEPVPLPPEQVPADSPLSGLATIAPEHDPAAAPGMLPAGKPRSAFRRSLDVFLDNKLAVTGVAIFVAMVIFCCLGRLMSAGQISLTVGIAAAMLATVIGVL